MRQVITEQLLKLSEGRELGCLLGDGAGSSVLWVSFEPFVILQPNDGPDWLHGVT